MLIQPNFDVAVVGLGALGSSALYQLARRGAKVIGFDRYRPPHAFGSSHGESRITRQAIGEGQQYVPLVLRSNAIWEELEAATGKRLLERCGFLFITRDDEGTSHHGKAGFLERTRAAAESFGIRHELLDAGDLALRFPQFTGLVGDERAYFEPGGGYLRPEACIEAALARAGELGATIVTDCRINNLQHTDAGNRLEVQGRTIVANQIIVATGGWITEFGHRGFDGKVEVHRQSLHWYQVKDCTSYSPEASPTFIWTHGLSSLDQFYGFPPIEGAVKVARENYDGQFDPDTGSREVPPQDIREMTERHVSGRLAGIAENPSRSQICHYSITPDSDFLIDCTAGRHFVSACSGHGFKHAAAIGEAVAQLAIDEMPQVDLSSFSSSRFRPTDL